MTSENPAGFRPYVLFCSFLLLCLVELSIANSNGLKDGLLRLEVKRDSGSFEALVAKDRHRWSFRSNPARWSPLKEYRKALERQEIQLHDNARYKSVSLGGNVVPGKELRCFVPLASNYSIIDGGYYVDLEIGGQKAAAQIDTGSSNLIVPVSGCSSCSSEGMIDISHSSSGAIIPCNSSSCNSNTCDSELCITGSCSSSSKACCLQTHGVSGCFFAVIYGPGAAAGVYFTDTVQIAGLTTKATVGGILTNVSGD